MYIDSELKEKLDSLPSESVQEVIDYLSNRITPPTRSMTEVLESIRAFSARMPKMDYEVVKTIQEGRDEGWE